ncbi:MAG: DUF951 domain-containing protein [Chloroflexota bacterium]|nr:DUF951 domain-containing protein [Chloroflexota bacterium]
MDMKIGDTVRLKKRHPCGSYDWQVVRLGADIGIKCLQCQHRVLLPRAVFERRVKAVISREESALEKTATDRIRELEEKLSDLLARWPAHSVPLHMWQQREDLEEELARLRKEMERKDKA